MELHVKKILEIILVYFKTFFSLCVCIFICIAVNLFLNGYVNSLKEQYEDLSPVASYVHSLNTDMVKFIQKHRMTGSSKTPENLRDLVENFSKKHNL
jgi:hypothetical protein